MTTKRVIWLFAVIACTVSAAAAEDWPQWGGTKRNFTSSVTGLASTWPTAGPRLAWSRNLGEGYSAVAVEGNFAYTMYRDVRSNQDVVIAMNVSDGKTVWERRYSAPAVSGMNVQYGPGPHTTPLIAGSRLITAGAMGHVHALDKATGAVVWSHNLHTEYGAAWERGYSSSPIAYRNTVIFTTGARGQSVIAFDQADGRVVWKKQNFAYGPSSPIVINVDGQDQLVVFMAEGPAGLDPTNGELLWTHAHKTDYGLNISTPVWGPDNILFISSAYNGGSRALHLSRQAGKTNVRELWSSNRMRVHFGTAVRVGYHIVGSSGDFGPAFLVAIHATTGQIAWQDRGFARASLLLADDKLIVLDEDGVLGLASFSPQGLKVLARTNALSNNAWTPPTLAGTRLIIRDRKTIRALDLK